jgi:hypothetical protein
LGFAITLAEKVSSGHCPSKYGFILINEQIYTN